MNKRNSTLLVLVFITSALFAQLPVFPPVANNGPFPTGAETVRNDAPINKTNDRTQEITPTSITLEYTAYKATPTIDGEFDEAAWNKIPWTEFQCNESRNDAGDVEKGYVHDAAFAPTIWGGLADFTAWFKVTHDADNVYVLTMRIDDEIDNSGTGADDPGGLWKNDAYQMVIDSREPNQYEQDSPGAETGFGHVGEDETYHYWAAPAGNNRHGTSTQLELADGSSTSVSPSSTGKAISYKKFAGWTLGGNTYDLHVMELAFKKYPNKFTDGSTCMFSLVALDRDAGLRFNTTLKFGEGIVGKDMYNYASIAWSALDTPPVGVSSINNSSLQLKNYPNPVGNMTQISYVLDNSENVSLNVFNASGKLVKTLVSEVQTSGPKTIDFDTSSLSNGVYFYTLRTASFSATQKFLK